MSRKNLDTLINKWISRKLFVFIVASLLLLFSELSSSDWSMISIVYLSGQSVADVLTTYAKIRTPNSEPTIG